KGAFDIEPIGETVRLTVMHNGFEPGSAILDGISKGWPRILSDLKTLLETADPPAVLRPQRWIGAGPRPGHRSTEKGSDISGERLAGAQERVPRPAMAARRARGALWGYR